MIDATFTNDLASAAPTPGGGGASAYAGALAAALASMVCNLTIGKPAFATVDAELRESLQELDSCRQDLLELIDGDARAFAALAATWKMPKETDEQKEARHLAGQAALTGACEVPIQIMRICAKIIQLDALLADRCTKLALSDVGASAILAKGALQAAELNVRINTVLMEDADLTNAYQTEAAELMNASTSQADQIYNAVANALCS